MWLCCSSNTETVHIFKLEEPKETYVNVVIRLSLWCVFYQVSFFEVLLKYCVCYNRPGQTTDEAQSWMGYLTKAVTASANYLPSQVTDVFTQGRAFASVHLPFQGLKNVCAITVWVPVIFNLLPRAWEVCRFFLYARTSYDVLIFRTHKIPKLLVASADGYLYVYNLDLTETGGCTLLKQHRFVISIYFLHCIAILID